MDKNRGFKNYLSVMYAGLIVIAAAITFFVYSLVKGNPDELKEYLIEEVDGVTRVDPGPGMPTPSAMPYVSPPTSPPPGA